MADESLPSVAAAEGPQSPPLKSPPRTWASVVRGLSNQISSSPTTAAASVPSKKSVIENSGSKPALSESTRPDSTSSLDPSKPVSDGSISASQVNSIASNNMPTRTTTRHSGGGSSLGNGLPSPPPPPPFPPVGGVGGSQSHINNPHSSQRNTPRARSNYGPNLRGNESYHNNHGSRREHDRRSVHLPPPYVPPPVGYMQGAAPFMAPPPPPPVRPFPGQMGSDIASSPCVYVPTMPPYWARPIVPPPPPMFFPHANANSLTNLIVNQIDYYFSDDNLAKDTFLRSKMDDHGWVRIALIASFPRVKQLTNDIQLILESLRYSSIVEVQGDKVRRRNAWLKWLPVFDRLN